MSDSLRENPIRRLERVIERLRAQVADLTRENERLRSMTPDGESRGPSVYMELAQQVADLTRECDLRLGAQQGLGQELNAARQRVADLTTELHKHSEYGAALGKIEGALGISGLVPTSVAVEAVRSLVQQVADLTRERDQLKRDCEALMQRPFTITVQRLERQVADLQGRLKVAEEALANPDALDDAMVRASRALAAIRKEPKP